MQELSTGRDATQIRGLPGRGCPVGLIVAFTGFFTGRVLRRWLRPRSPWLRRSRRRFRLRTHFI